MDPEIINYFRAGVVLMLVGDVCKNMRGEQRFPFFAVTAILSLLGWRAGQLAGNANAEAAFMLTVVFCVVRIFIPFGDWKVRAVANILIALVLCIPTLLAPIRGLLWP